MRFDPKVCLSIIVGVQSTNTLFNAPEAAIKGSLLSILASHTFQRIWPHHTSTCLLVRQFAVIRLVVSFFPLAAKKIEEDNGDARPLSLIVSLVSGVYLGVKAFRLIHRTNGWVAQ